MNLVDWCIENNKEDYLTQWDETLNSNLSPKDVSYGSSKKVYWTCDERHTWITSVNNRTSKSDSKCPYCSGKKVWKGFNDLETRYPSIALEWDYEKNDTKPCDFHVSSNRKVGWVCSVGHHFEAKINDRTKKNGTGCPYCSGQKVLIGYNDLQCKYPEIAAEWDSSRNEKHVWEVSARSGYRAWWLCNKGHSYSARIYDRTKKNGTGCPYCAGRKTMAGFNDLDFLFPEIAREWDYEKNDFITPKMVNNRKWIWQ